MNHNKIFMSFGLTLVGVVLCYICLSGKYLLPARLRWTSFDLKNIINSNKSLTAAWSSMIGSDTHLHGRGSLAASTEALISQEQTRGDSLTSIYPTALSASVSNMKTVATLGLSSPSISRRIINPHEYKLLIAEPFACYNAAGNPKEVFLLVLVTSSHAHTERRTAIRETWGNPLEVRGKPVVTLFLFGYDQNATIQRQLKEESSKHHDVLQEDFEDTYRNLTLKTIMGLKWASTHCPHASYVMKTDDDVYVNIDKLVRLLSETSTPSANYAVGNLLSRNIPIRNPRSKIYMPKEMFPESVFPPYLTGSGYVMSADVTRRIVEVSLFTKLLPIEDVFVGVCLKWLNIKPIGNKNFDYSCHWGSSPSSRTCNMIIYHLQSSRQMYDILRICGQDSRVATSN
ncbi:beta-1,3-galactosyltransferase 1-like [Acanthaster planci]|uniref:Hexosyltransferase n=1 Tax=Acanthaster planci TaxID=133434 RepID=A0A8B7ZZJ3_ACAPL|nr:beta-1,3-galactosyltransferase 1-like [Acanthaster planci]